MISKLIYKHKAKIQKKYILELSIWKIPDKERYPDGIKYSLICLDINTENKILFDNHYPKGPHIHINEEEIKYDYVDENKLVDDFSKIIFEHFGVKL